MSTPPPFTRLLRDLPAMVPFVAPEAMERARGRPLVLRLGANESAFGVSPRARAAMSAALERVAWYGDPAAHDLRGALAPLHAAAPDNIMIGSGIDDLLGLIVRAYLEPGQGAVASRGAYPTFAYHVAGYGGVLHGVPYRDGSNDLAALAAAAEQVGARLVYLANPDNPTGTWHPAPAVLSFLDALPDGCLLLLDEAYADFAPSAALPVLSAADPRVIRLRTFSKAHGMAGARIGYAVAARETVAAFDKIRLHFGVNSVAQAGALASLGDPAFLGGVVAAVDEGRRDYADLARRLGLFALPSAANFVAIDMGGAARARAAVRALLERDVFVRMPGVPPLNRFIRVTVGTPTDRAAFGVLLPEVLRDLRDVPGEDGAVNAAGP